MGPLFNILSEDGVLPIFPRLDLEQGRATLTDHAGYKVVVLIITTGYSKYYYKNYYFHHYYCNFSSSSIVIVGVVVVLEVGYS